MHYFFIPIRKEVQNHFAFIWNKPHYTSSVLLQGYINSPGLYHNIKRPGLTRHPAEHHIRTSCKSDPMSTKWKAFIKYMYYRGREMKLNKNSGAHYHFRLLVVWGMLGHPLQSQSHIIDYCSSHPVAIPCLLILLQLI